MSDPPYALPGMASITSSLPGMPSTGMGGMGGGMGGIGGGGGDPHHSHMSGPAAAQAAAAATTAGVVAASTAITSAESMLNAQLASALSTMGDSQYFEESISPSQIRTSLSQADPSNPSSTPTLLRGMKWLLACITKGRDVSDFFPHVVKLVGSHSLEVRKMVYMYLVRYADFDPTCRELALLGINSFQRGLADGEPLIRALALRVLTSIGVRDILQIQIMAVQRCAADGSPYVRKCAANALTKLGPRCANDAQRGEALMETMTKLLDDDSSTMVLTSAMVAFSELCPDRLDLLHQSYRKICHLLTDMDEWGQVVVMDVLSRYCRRFFREPGARSAGSAELVDKERRVRRTVSGIAREVANAGAAADVGDALDALLPSEDKNKSEQSQQGQQQPQRGSVAPQKVRRRVVRKAFYSDEEDESSVEDVYADDVVGAALPVATAMRQRNVLGLPKGGAGGVGGGGGMGGGWGSPGVGDVGGGGGLLQEDEEESTLDADHRLLLRSSLPLLKSRNSAVVLAVCSLHYYCGVASIKVRSAMGKALVRIYRGRREVQFVVLTSIKALVKECPSAFAPFLHDFFVKAMDPSFTRTIKLDILTSLTLDPPSIEAVLRELRTYVRHDDKLFVRASVRAVGRVAEMARIVHDRRGLKTGDLKEARADANVVALNCLYGLLTLAECSEDARVVGECVVVMEQIVLMLLPPDDGSAIAGGGAAHVGSSAAVEDANGVQSMALRRLVLLLVRALASRGHPDHDGNEGGGADDDDGEGDDDDGDDKASSFDELRRRTVLLPPSAVAPALWIVGEWFCTVAFSSSSSPLPPSAIPLFNVDAKDRSHMRSELLRLVARSFPDLDPCEKLQGVHFASKALLLTKEDGRSSTSKRGADDVALCESILAMGRMDVRQDVRDRARYESNLLNASVGLSQDTEALSSRPVVGRTMTAQDARAMLQRRKPASSHLEIDVHDVSGGGGGGDAPSSEVETFRFGTLSSLVSHRAGRSYLPLPKWAARDSPSSLRDPAAGPESPGDGARGPDGWKVRQEGGKAKAAASFYDSDEESASTDEDSSSASSSSESNSESEEESSSSEEESSDDESSTSSEDTSEEESSEEVDRAPAVRSNGGGFGADMLNGPVQSAPVPVSRSSAPVKVEDASDDNDESSYDSSSGDESSASSDAGAGAASGNLLNMGAPAAAKKRPVATRQTSSGSSVADGLEGLVMAPLVVDRDDAGSGEADAEMESSLWKPLVRPELGGGLSMKARFLRGLTMDREAKLMGLDPKTSTVLCVQIKFENKRTDAGILRRIRLVQRSSSGSGTFSPRRFVIPQEIGALKKGQASTVVLGLEFAQASDKDRSYLARFDVKTDRGSNAIEIRPPLGEMLKTCRMSRSEFDETISRLHGIHQRTVTSFSLVATNGKSVQQLYEVLPAKLVKYANLTPVDKKLIWKDNACSFVGDLPASGTPLCAIVKCDPQTGAGDITVCCENLMAANSVADLWKRAASSDGGD